MNRKYILNDTALSDQIILMIMAGAFSCLFFSCLMLAWTMFFIILGIMPLTTYIPLHFYMRQFAEIYTDGNTFL